ncbi:MAG: GNAT family N-acetyltransferase [Chloroflexota bacterium]|nr:GNAT family N-acetyltransferase [Chloroflexota bacterium]MBI5704242.1 GNAT family N-acetyltransferase [Chloroflexota bacterium]
MSGFTLRRAEVKDASRIAHVHVRAWQETYRGLMPDSVLDTLSVERRMKQWEQILEGTANLYHLVFVAEADGQVVGFANYGKEREGDPDYQGELFAIYILKEFQGQGIGRALVQKAALGLLEMDISSMLVWVLSNNPYRKFYERLNGQYLREKSIQIGDSVLQEAAYGWRDVRILLGQG